MNKEEIVEKVKDSLISESNESLFDRAMEGNASLINYAFKNFQMNEEGYQHRITGEQYSEIQIVGAWYASLMN